MSISIRDALRICRSYVRSQWTRRAGTDGSKVRRWTVRVAILMAAVTTFFVCVSCCIEVEAQSPAEGTATTASSAKAQAPKEFDVAAIRLNTDGGENWSTREPGGGRYTARGITVRTLILNTLHIKDFQLEGAPKWLDSERYDIDARADLNRDFVRGELSPLVLNLLVSRFGMNFHHEVKEGPIYSLVAAKGGARLHPNTGAPQGTDWGKDHINAIHRTVGDLADVLEVQLDRVVRNDAGIDGVYDFKLTWDPTDQTGPTIFTALQEQYGLRLVAAKGPVEMTVIDHVQRPTGN
jgi:uncharacterized protein (TIGR03435 family)